MVYERKLWDRGYDGYPTVENSLFSAFQLEKMLILISINTQDMVLLLIKMEHFLVDRGFGKNVIIFGADISLSAHIDNKTF